MFGLGRRCVGIWESWCVRIWDESVKKMGVFGLGYNRVDLWVKFIEICEWCDDCEKILNFGSGYDRVDVWVKFIKICEWCDDCEEILIFLKV